jgi:hypothetical protein
MIMMKSIENRGITATIALKNEVAIKNGKIVDEHYYSILKM